MNTEWINSMLEKACGKSFVGVYARDRLPERLPKGSCLLVANTDASKDDGRHWIAMYVGADGYGEFFDSFGEKPHRSFKVYMDKQCKNWQFNDKQLQSIVSHFCGGYTVLFCAYRSVGYSMSDIVGLFTSDYSFNDFIVHLITCKLMPV
jgi:hypothetical protein